MKLEVGMYVRTIGGIERLKKENDNGWFFEKSMIIKPDNIEKYIIKARHNIIDLIEYDDILKIIYEDKEYICKVVNAGGIRGVQLTSTLSVGLGIVEAGIKSIVTKEQFEVMKYEIK